MTRTIACMLAGLGQGHEAWYWHPLGPRPVDVADTTIHPYSSWLPYAFMLPILSHILALTNFP